MTVKDTIQEIIGSINLMNLSSSRNNNSPRSKDTHGDSLAFSLALSRALTLAELFTLADSLAWVSCIIEELGIDALIDRLLQHTK